MTVKCNYQKPRVRNRMLLTILQTFAAVVFQWSTPFAVNTARRHVMAWGCLQGTRVICRGKGQEAPDLIWVLLGVALRCVTYSVAIGCWGYQISTSGDVTIGVRGLRNIDICSTRINGFWSGRDLYRALPAVTQDLVSPNIVDFEKQFHLNLQWKKNHAL